MGTLSDNVFVLRLIFTQKSEMGTVPLIRRHATIQFPVFCHSEAVRVHRSKFIGESDRSQVARQAALAILSTNAEPVLWPCDDALWYKDRPYVIDEKTHDYEENGVKVWKISLAAS